MSRAAGENGHRRASAGGIPRPLAAPRAHLPGAAQQLRHVHAQVRGRHDTEVGERRVTAADARIAGEDVPHAPLARFLLQRRAGVRDDQESLPRLTAEGRFRARVEVVEEDVGLQRGAGLRGDEVTSWIPGRRAGRVRAMEDASSRGLHVRIARARREGGGEDERSQARASHAEHEQALRPGRVSSTSRSGRGLLRLALGNVSHRAHSR